MRKSFEEQIFGTVFDLAYKFGCYYTGRLVIFLVSLGRWKCDGFDAPAPQRKGRVCYFYSLRSSQVYVSRRATHGVGLLVIVFLLFGGLLIWYHKSVSEAHPTLEKGGGANLKTEHK
jgi:hypothetical protein